MVRHANPIAEPPPPPKGTEAPELHLPQGLLSVARPMLSLAEQIAERVGQAIITGVYPPGRRIPEQELAASFRTSRGPVREALRILEKDGLAEIRPRRGAYVTNLSIKDVEDIFVIRASLFGIAARLTAGRHEPQAIARLREGAEQLRVLAEGRANVDDYVAATFHLSCFLAESSGNKRLPSIVASLARQTLRYSRLGLSTQTRRLQSAGTWRRLVEAVARGEAASAEAAAQELVNNSRNMAIHLLEAGKKVS